MVEVVFVVGSDPSAIDSKCSARSYIWRLQEGGHVGGDSVVSYNLCSLRSQLVACNIYFNFRRIFALLLPILMGSSPGTKVRGLNQSPSSHHLGWGYHDVPHMREGGSSS